MELKVSGRKAYQHLKKLVDIGTRLAGTDGEKRASDYLLSEMENLNLDVMVQEFDVTTYETLEQTLTIIKPDIGEIQCKAVGLSASTPLEGVSAEVVYAETGDPIYLTSQMEGKILMITKSLFGMSYRDIMKVKPLAVICIEGSVGIPPKIPILHPEWRKYGEAPILRISYNDGLRLLKEGVQEAFINVKSKEIKSTSRNIISELKGTQCPDEVVVIGGHYDTVSETTGAGDNAGGTAIMLELARVFSKRKSRRTMRFIGWGAEEMGGKFLGSKHYVRVLKETGELEKIKLVLNFDVHGAMIGQNSASILGPTELTEAVRLLASEQGVAFNISERSYSSDNLPFSIEGVPSLTLSRGGGSNVFMHSHMDSIKFLDEKYLEVHCKFSEAFLVRYIGESSFFPFKREIPEEHKKKINRYLDRRLVF